jgi:hypothetical protein
MLFATGQITFKNHIPARAYRPATGRPAAGYCSSAQAANLVEAAQRLKHVDQLPGHKIGDDIVKGSEEPVRVSSPCQHIILTGVVQHVDGRLQGNRRTSDSRLQIGNANSICAGRNPLCAKRVEIAETVVTGRRSGDDCGRKPQP